MVDAGHRTPGSRCHPIVQQTPGCVTRFRPGRELAYVIPNGKLMKSRWLWSGSVGGHGEEPQGVLGLAAF
jgi:hypothetical protein